MPDLLWFIWKGCTTLVKYSTQWR